MKIDDIKNKILQLAIQGKLVPQDKNDEPAAVLLEKIKAEKEQLIKEKKIKKEKPLPEISEEEKVFEIPEGWQWCRIGDLGSYKKGPFGSTITKSMFVPKSNHTIKIYEQKNAIQKNWELGNYYVTEEYFESKLTGFEVFEGDIIVSCAGTIGEAYVMPQGIERGVINQALMKMRMFSNVNIEYFLIYFESVLKDTAKDSSKGSAIKNIPPFDIFKKLVFALPPLQEQRRIVAKVDELFAIVDELSENKDAMAKCISDTRNKVLQLAIQGKLVPQDAQDEPASVLMEKIREEKAKLIKEKKIKKEKPLSEISGEEKVFEIPEGWEWCRLNDITSVLGDGLHGTPQYDECGEYFFVNGNNLSNGKIEIKDDTKRVDYNQWEKYKKPLNSNTILVSINGTIGNVAFYNNEKVILGKSACYFNVFDSIDKMYLYFFLKTTYFLNYATSMATGSTIKNVSLMVMRSTSIPIPPLEEQKRIVAKVDEIMIYLDDLEQALLA